MKGHFKNYTAFWSRVNRILSLFLTLVILGCFLSIFVYSRVTSGAEKDDGFVPPVASNYAEPMVRVGMVYGSSVRSSYAFTSDGILNYGYNTHDKSEFTPLGSLPAGSYTVNNAGGCTLCFAGSGENSEADYQSLYQQICSLLGEDASGLYPMIKDGVQILCLGNYDTEAKAQAAAELLCERYGFSFSDGISPLGDNADPAPLYTLSVYAFSSDHSLWLKDSGGKNAVAYDSDSDSDPRRLAVCPDLDMGYYIIVGSDLYESFFEFNRYVAGNYNGVSVITVIPLETYVKGVLSEELYTFWDLEVQKAFAVIIRTYTLKNWEKHSAYGFSVCNNTNCQVYEGCRKVNDTIREAVKDTRGIILTDEGSVAAMNYATVGGGSTVNCEESWVSPRTYLKAVATPWERYRDYGSLTIGGTWHLELTGEELYQMLSPYYSQLKGEIVDVNIDEFCTNSSYVLSLTVTDLYGNQVTMRKADTIRNRLGLRSGNFVIGKAGQTVKAPVYELDCYPSIYNETRDFAVYKKTGDVTFLGIMAKGAQRLLSGIVQVVYPDGELSHDITGAESEIIMPSDSYRVNESGLPDILDGETVMYYEYINLISENDRDDVFIIEGKGYGHGIGICQYGAWDLAAAGYDYLTILRYYFKDVTFGKVTDFIH
ncbi:MAG: SpoIID/LytB domain-containing protein [Ruminococcaceae bacterium]|nr:SpoIID/LytB domain-containing protein [Oscillospiraceae bacterium]